MRSYHCGKACFRVYFRFVKKGDTTIVGYGFDTWTVISIRTTVITSFLHPNEEKTSNQSTIILFHI